METIRIVLDRKLLQAVDQAARRMRQSRSAIVRDAVRVHVQGLEVRALEERDRRGYAKNPDQSEGTKWEAEAAWPTE